MSDLAGKSKTILRRRARWRCRGGFTLLEALAAGMILAISAMVMLPSLSGATSSVELSQDMQQASDLLDGILTKVDLIGPERLGNEGPTSGQFGKPYEKFSWQVTITPKQTGHLYEVTAQVSWPVGGGVRTACAQTLLNDSPGSRDKTLKWEGL